MFQHIYIHTYHTHLQFRDIYTVNDSLGIFEIEKLPIQISSESLPEPARNSLRGAAKRSRSKWFNSFPVENDIFVVKTP